MQPDNKNFEATMIQAAMAATISRVEIGCIVHADIWHVYGHKDQVTHKTQVLKQICDEVGRDFSTFELTTFHVPQYLGSGDADPSVYLDLGIRNVIGLTQGPDWSMDGLKYLLAWRKAVTSR